MFRRSVDDQALAPFRDVQAFSELPERDLALIAKLADLRHAEDGAVLVSEEEVGTEVFLLVEGEVRVLREDEEVARLGPGQFFGEMALLEDRPRSATVVAAGDVRALAFDPRAVDEMPRTQAEPTRKVLAALATDIRGDREPTVETRRFVNRMRARPRSGR